MKWKHLVTRDVDLLKNCLLYEAMVENFKKVYKINHPSHLTIICNNTFSHYIEENSNDIIKNFIISRGQEQFLKKCFKELKNKFLELHKHCKKIKYNKEFIKKYFQLYKNTYPYFMISAWGEGLNNESIKILSHIRWYARNNFEKTHELINPFFEKLAKNKNTTIDKIKFLTPPEIIKLVSGNDIDINKKFNQRQNCFFIQKNGVFIFSEESNLEIIYKLDFELSGSIANKGKYTGKVKIIIKPEELNKINKGDILITRMTTPKFFVPEIKKVGAIVTDEGGVTCHAGILSREINVPCIVGTKNATSILKDGDVIEVDANKGVIRIIK
jgi:phosphohistidine swiveling domain-containing protein